MDYNILMVIISVVIVFLFSVRKFSRQVQRVAGDRFKDYIKKITKTPIKGTFVGAGVTAVLQTSAATTVILVGLVHSGLISFRNSLGVIFGANIGTTITSQLVALKLTSIAPIFIIFGFFLELFGNKDYRVFGRPIFYFGLVFFSLSLIATYIEPISSSPEVLTLLSSTSNIFLALLIGFGFTFLVQSSSITSGLVVVLVGGGLLDFHQAVGIILGANIGSTTTAIISSFGLSKDAKKTALAHFLYNVLGVLMFLPLLVPFSNLVISLGGSPAQQIANAHLIFNLILAVIFLIFIKHFESFVNFVWEIFRFGKKVKRYKN